MAIEHWGRCLCGSVQYRVSGPLPEIEICHCQQCQRAQGGAWVSVLPLARSDFTLLAGADLLSAYRATPGKERVFCSRCGSPLFSRRDDAPERLRLRSGTLDAAKGLKVASHAHVASKVEWLAGAAQAPEHAGPRPALKDGRTHG